MLRVCPCDPNIEKPAAAWLPDSFVLTQRAQKRLASVEIAVAVSRHELGSGASGDARAAHGKRTNVPAQPKRALPIRMLTSHPGFSTSSDSESAA
jgi:hypothetical protein